VRSLPLFLAVLQAVEPTPLPERPPDGAAAAPAIRGADIDLLRAVRTIAGRVAEMQGAAFERPPVAVRASAELREAAAEIRALNAAPRDRLEARGRAWVDIGLGSAESPARVYRVLAADLDGVGFDPQGNRLLVDPERLTDADFDAGASDPAAILMSTGVRPDEPLVGHVLVHVRQRERSGADWLGATTDGTLARVAWAEGEANLLAIRYLFEGLGLSDAAIESGLDPGAVLDGRLLPPGLDGLAAAERELVRFVYEDGFAAAAAAFRADGFAGVARSAGRRTTTRDLSHGDLEPLGRSSDAADPALPPGLALADEDVLGEQGIFVLVSTLTGKDNLALQAADGWIGDRLLRFEPRTAGSPDRGMTHWRTRWVDEAASADFEYALVRSLEARFPGRTFAEVGPGTRVLATPERVFRIEREPIEVRLVVVPPDPPAPTERPGRS